MPYSEEADYIHIRRRPPKSIIENTFRTVPWKRVPGVRKKYPKGTMMIRGKSNTTGKWVTQAILIPKER